MGRRELDKSKVLNKSKDIIDRVISKARKEDYSKAKISLDKFCKELDRPRSTLYHISLYSYFTENYESVQYKNHSGGLTVKCEKWVEERKEERKEIHKQKEKESGSNTNE